MRQHFVNGLVCVASRVNAASRFDHEQAHVQQHVSRFRIIKPYSSNMHAADVNLHFNKRPKSSDKPHEWQQCGCCTSMATQTARSCVSSCICAVLSYVVAIAVTAIAAHSTLSFLYAQSAKMWVRA